MRRLILLVFSAISFTAFGQPKEIMDMCETKSAAAASIMESRQAGERMPSMMGRAHNSDRAAKDKKKMVLEAFDVSRKMSAADKKEAIVDFENKKYQECMRLWVS